MPGPFDASSKSLLKQYAADWVAWLGWPGRAVEALDTDLATIAAAADSLYRVADDEPFLLNLELMSYHQVDLPVRLHRYATLAESQFGLPSHTIVVLLRPAANSPSFMGEHQWSRAGQAYRWFRYGVVRVWQEPVERFLNGPPGLWPLAPLSNVGGQAVEGVIQSLQHRLQQEVPESEQELLWDTTFVLMGLRYPAELIRSLGEKVYRMKESTLYQSILEEGRQEGIAHGLREGLQQGLQQGQDTGKVQEARSLVLRLGRRKFGEPTEAVAQRIAAIVDLAQLESLAEQLLEANTWDDLTV